MRTPSHWKNINLLSVLLWPFGCLYGLATACRIRSAKPGKVKAKVICIGNLTAGGTGKTPVAISLAAMLQKRGLSPCFITRGYGGTLQDVLVEPQIHTAWVMNRSFWHAKHLWLSTATVIKVPAKPSATAPIIS